MYVQKIILGAWPVGWASRKGGEGELLRNPSIPGEAHDGFREGAQPILVLARRAIMGRSMKEWSGLGGHPGRAADRRIVPIRSL